MSHPADRNDDTSAATPYPRVPTRPDLPALEEAILRRWRSDGTFEASVEERETGERGANEFVFYDGPPFANGLPHHGHLLTGYVKDVVPRYQTMRGRRVERRFGWDCHGLPAEMEAEKELGVSGRRDITSYGIAEFNDHCRSSVMRYTQDWRSTVERQARWVDFDHDYKTMDLSYMESVIWAFKQLWDKGLVYEAYRVMPYSWGAETPLSNFEIRLDDATRPRQDPAITVAFDLEPRPGDPGPMRILAWTTTPWTLPSNLALAVGADIEYSIMAEAGEDGTIYTILGSAAVERYGPQLADAELHGTVSGAELAERTYQPLFDYFADTPNAFRVLLADFVGTADGTGIVHLAPGFGEDDQVVSEAAGISLVVPVDDEGRFTDDVPEWAGENVFDANPSVIAALKERGRIVRHDTYDHNYPHCWRTDTPIIYRALSSWYVKVTDIRDRMLELNREINWIPDHVRDGRFGKWLEGARDWSISRNRFWGSPIPVWRSDDPEYPRIDVYGSLDEIERDFGVRLDDLHRPTVDALVRPNPDDPTGKSMMRRVPEVLDCWFESGSMPYAQVHYPFENRDWFEDHFPADFIVEYVNQTRGWFYTLHVLSTALFDRPPFRNAICHGILLASDGAKLSKRLKNYTDPTEIFSTKGSDALRWYLVSSPVVRGGEVRVDDDEITDVIRLVINPIWNAYSFFTLYANADGISATERTTSTHVLDRYLLAKTHDLVTEVTAAMDAYDLPAACGRITAFLDALNNWYIRRSRDRFWAPAAEVDPEAKRDAYDTLYTVLTTLVRVAAPMLPLVTEEIHTGLTGARSVHLTDWPEAADLPGDPALVAAMDRARDVASVALGIREDNGIAARVPLARLTVHGHGAEALAPFVDLLADEVNVKHVDLADELDADITFELKPNGRLLGPRLGGDMQKVLAGARAGEWTPNADGSVIVADHTLTGDEFELSLVAEGHPGTAALRTNDAVVTLDLNLTEELIAEGRARHMVRSIQQARRDSGLEVTDRIVLTLDVGGDMAAAVEAHRGFISDQVLATELVVGPVGEDAPRVSLDGADVGIEVTVVGGT
ncbi:MAG: isoleucine--tRNA ligase [Acidimicrobiales bacterium]